MKIKRKSLFLLIALISVLLTSTIPANALNTGFDIYDMPAEEKASFISNINLSLITEEPAQKSIVCFDVSNNHLIAVGQNDFNRRKTICVYSTDGVFQYGYTFNCYANFGVEWDNENLNICFTRSYAIVSVTPSGEIESVLKIQNTAESHSYWSNYVFLNKRKIGNSEYSLQNNLGTLNIFAISSYSKVIATNESGETSVIYDATEEHLVETSFFVATLTLFFVMFFGIGIKLLIKKSRGY